MNDNTKNKKVTDDGLESISGGWHSRLSERLSLDDVMGIDGLRIYVYEPNEKTPNGTFWEYKGIAVTKEEAFKIIKKHSKEKSVSSWLEDNEIHGAEHDFFVEYVENYNKEINGPT